ncbi:MAG: hypothetical protein ACT4ON_06750 [Bacteroidota bacterium]
MKMRSFTFRLLLYSLFIAIVDYSWNELMPDNVFVTHIWFIFIFFVLSTMIFHFFSMISAEKKPQYFIRFYMGSTALRMMLCLIVIITYRFINKPSFVPFAIAFMVHYFLFTIFEVILLLRYLRK